MSKLARDFFNILTIFEKTGKLLSLKQFQNLPEEVERRKLEDAQEKAIKNQIATIKKNAKSRKADFLGLLPHQIDPDSWHKFELNYILPFPTADAPIRYHTSPPDWTEQGIYTYWRLFFAYSCQEQHPKAIVYLKKLLIAAENHFYGEWLNTLPPSCEKDWQKRLKTAGVSEITPKNYWRVILPWTDNIQKSCIAALILNQRELAVHFAEAIHEKVDNEGCITNIYKHERDFYYVLVRYIATGQLLTEYDSSIALSKSKSVLAAQPVLQAIAQGNQIDFELRMQNYLKCFKRVFRISGGPWQSLTGSLFYYLAKQKGLTIPDAVEKSPYLVTDYWLTKPPEGSGK